MFIKENMVVKATCDDNTTYMGKVYKIVIQLCDDDNNKPHAMLFISQDEKRESTDCDFGCVSLWVDRLKSIEVI